MAVDDEQENKDKLDENKLIVCLDAGHGGKDNGLSLIHILMDTTCTKG